MMFKSLRASCSCSSKLTCSSRPQVQTENQKQHHSADLSHHHLLSVCPSSLCLEFCPRCCGGWEGLCLNVGQGFCSPHPAHTRTHTHTHTHLIDWWVETGLLFPWQPLWLWLSCPWVLTLCCMTSIAYGGHGTLRQLWRLWGWETSGRFSLFDLQVRSNLCRNLVHHNFHLTPFSSKMIYQYEELIVPDSTCSYVCQCFTQTGSPAHVRDTATQAIYSKLQATAAASGGSKWHDQYFSFNHFHWKLYQFVWKYAKSQTGGQEESQWGDSTADVYHVYDVFVVSRPCCCDHMCVRVDALLSQSDSAVMSQSPSLVQTAASSVHINTRQTNIA